MVKVDTILSPKEDIFMKSHLGNVTFASVIVSDVFLVAFYISILLPVKIVILRMLWNAGKSDIERERETES